ncbi:hypothetical protein HDU86_005162 [Geranomyces michiganensis]|nr:hypothetical protein HDU86_005162 [Geranomyces michiganensis]
MAMPPSGYLYVLTPVALGVTVLLIVAALVNNLFGRPYPQYWLYPASPRKQSQEMGLSPLNEKDRHHHHHDQHHQHHEDHHQLSTASPATQHAEISMPPLSLSLSSSSSSSASSSPNEPPPPAPLRVASLDEGTLHQIEAFLEHEAAVGVGSERTGGPHGGAMGSAALQLESYRAPSELTKNAYIFGPPGQHTVNSGISSQIIKKASTHAKIANGKMETRFEMLKIMRTDKGMKRQSEV